MPGQSRAAWALLCAGVSAWLTGDAAAQSAQATQLAIIQAEERGATTPRDLLVIKNGTHSENVETARMAVRSLGRLERPSQMSDILPLLRHPLPELRAEAANAVAQAAQGLRVLK